MKSKILKVLGALTPVFALGLMVSTAHAQFSTTTAVATQATFVSDIAYVIGATIAGILGLLASLTGLGWAVRKFRHYVSGRKF